MPFVYDSKRQYFQGAGVYKFHFHFGGRTKFNQKNLGNEIQGKKEKIGGKKEKKEEKNKRGKKEGKKEKEEERKERG